MLSTYAQYQVYARNLSATLKRVAAEPTVARDTAYYQANIGKVKTVDDFIGNYRLFSYAMKAGGLGDAVQNRGFMRKVLTSDLSDPKSFANTQNDARYKAFAAFYDFSKTGKVVSTAAAQDTAQQSDTVARFGAQSLVGNAQSADIAYYKAHIGQVTSVDALVSDSRLYRIALQAYGIDPATTSAGTIRQALTSDISNPNSMVNSSGHPADAAQSAADTVATIQSYAAAAGTDAASQAETTIETAYYGNAMPAVTDVDSFLSDDRLVAYAAKAFGLDDTSPAVLALAKANGADITKPLSASVTSDILRAALTSDLSDPRSVANTLGGGFAAAAAAYNFGPTAIQSPAAASRTMALYAQTVGTDAASQTAATAETRYYAATMPKVKTADQFLADPRLVAYATEAYGLTFPAGSTPAVQAATLKAVLTGDPTDLQGAAAKAGSVFVSFAADFNSARTVDAQGADAAESTVDLYGQASGQDSASAEETAYYLHKMPDVKTADALVSDAQLSAYVTAAYGITFPAGAGDAEKQARLKSILTDDPAVAGAAYGDGARRLAAAFQFNAAGNAQQGRNAVTATGLAPQPPAALQATVDLYTERLGTDPGAQLAGNKETAYYKSAVAKVTTVDAFVADPRLVAYAAAAYGVSFPDSTTAADEANEIKAILTSDPDDPKSAASQLGDSARQLASAFTFNATYTGDDAIGQGGQASLVRLAAAFNFDSGGHVTDPKLAQSAKDMQTTLSAYVKQAGTTGNAAAQADATYYSASIGKVKTLDGFLSDPRLVKVATAAFGIARPAGLSDAQWTAQLKGVLTSNIADPKSAASKLGTPYRDMAAAFTFAPDGTTTRDPAQLAQSKKAAILTADPYAQQAMDTEATGQNKAVGLALRFQQQAPTITSAYQILADKSLLAFVQTAFNLPSSMSTLDIDTQARIITDAVKPADLQDPKKLATIIKNFATRTDINAAQTATSTSVLTLFDRSGSASSDSLLSIVNPAGQGVDTSSMPILTLFGLG
jgi:hypothetical protein